jgi:hypothetical protein
MNGSSRPSLFQERRNHWAGTDSNAYPHLTKIMQAEKPFGVGLSKTSAASQACKAIIDWANCLKRFCSETDRIENMENTMAQFTVPIGPEF